MPIAPIHRAEFDFPDDYYHGKGIREIHEVFPLGNFDETPRFSCRIGKHKYVTLDGPQPIDDDNTYVSAVCKHCGKEKRGKLSDFAIKFFRSTKVKPDERLKDKVRL